MSWKGGGWQVSWPPKGRFISFLIISVFPKKEFKEQEKLRASRKPLLQLVLSCFIYVFNLCPITSLEHLTSFSSPPFSLHNNPVLLIRLKVCYSPKVTQQVSVAMWRWWTWFSQIWVWHCNHIGSKTTLIQASLWFLRQTGGDQFWFHWYIFITYWVSILSIWTLNYSSSVWMRTMILVISLKRLKGCPLSVLFAEEGPSLVFMHMVKTTLFQMVVQQFLILV